MLLFRSLTFDPNFAPTDYFLEDDIFRRFLVEEHRRRVNENVLRDVNC